MRKGLLFAVLITSFVYGCSQGIETESTELTEQANGIEPAQAVPLANNYYRFDKAHFEQSMHEGKVIFLDFHANWCPICASEKPRILAAFNELNNADVVGYEVHFNDGETTQDDKEMAKTYGITNQYTKVIVDKNGNVALKTLEILGKNRIINELEKVAGG